MTRTARLTPPRLGPRAPGVLRPGRPAYPGRVLLALLVVALVLFVVLPVLGATVWALLTTLLVGLVLGGLARLIVPGRTRLSLTTTALVGVVGSLLGTLLAQLLDRGSFAQLLLQIGVAVALVLVLRPEPAA